MASPPPDFPRLLSGLSLELQDEGIGFMLIGGQAVLLHGRPRLTEDVDVTLAAGPEALPRVLDVCRRLGLEPLPEHVDDSVPRPSSTP